jgi:uncharacterized protein (TIGR02145 family)
MKKYKSHLIYELMLIGLILILSGSCKKNDEANITALGPVTVVFTSEINNITVNSAITGGNIVGSGIAIVTAKGVCWSVHDTPTIADFKTNNGAGSGLYSSILTGLKRNTQYYLCAYAIYNSGTTYYGNKIKFRTYTDSIYDIDTNLYYTTTIGKQECIAENLKVTKFSNGDAIPYVGDNLQWSKLNSAAYCDYNNLKSNTDVYGKLYNWYTVNDKRNICPDGWHVPSVEEWSKLEKSIGGKNMAGGKLKERGIEHWKNPNVGATNDSAFRALPGGYRFVDGTFYYIGSNGYWWSSSQVNSIDANARSMFNYAIEVNNVVTNKSNGLSVRCWKN